MQRVGSVDGERRVDLVGIRHFDTVVYVRSSCSGYEWSCNDDYYGSRQGRLYFSAQPGVDYYVFVDGWGTESGDYVFELTEW